MQNNSAQNVIDRKSSVILRNCLKIFDNVRATFAQVLENLRKSSKSSRKSSEIVKSVVISMSI